MKVLFDHASPFLLAHGGFQIQIEQTRAGLEKVGVEVEYVRWWDGTQAGDIIHFFGRPSEGYVDFAHQKGMKVVLEELHTGLGSRGNAARFFQKTLMRFSQALLPPAFTAKLAWESYRKADAFVANTSWEGQLMREMFDADSAKIHILPNGVEETFFKDSPSAGNRNNFLVCTATITPRKRVVELCRAAILAQTPLWIIGKPYSTEDPYYLGFLELQKQNAGLLRYEGGISDRNLLATIYHEARGFVLLSAMETRSLSSEEAAASGCPLLLSDLPWARSTFQEHATYCPLGSVANEAGHLRSFYDQAPSSTPTYKPKTWTEVGSQLKSIYQSILTES